MIDGYRHDRVDEADLSLTVLVVEKDDWRGAAEAITPLAKQGDCARVAFLVVIDENSDPADEEQLTNYFTGAGIRDRVSILRSPEAGLAAGWSFGAAISTTTHIVRLDAHGAVPGEFLRHSFAALSAYGDGQRELIPGGPVGLRPAPEVSGQLMPEVIAAVESSALFSGGMGPHKKPLTDPTVADFSARALYPTSLIRQLGGFRTMPFACEDTEFAGRVVRSGYRYVLLPELLSWHYPRVRLAGFVKQKARNGGAIGYLLATGSPSSPRKLLPLGALLLGFAGVASKRRSRSLVVLAAGYSAAAVFGAWPALAARPLSWRGKIAGIGLTPLVAFSGHSSFALGQLRGVASGLREGINRRRGSAA